MATQARNLESLKITMNEETLAYKIIFVTNSDPENGAPHLGMAAFWMKKQGMDVLCVMPGNTCKKNVTMGGVEIDACFISKSVGRLGSILWQLRLALKLLDLRRAGKKQFIFYLHGNVITPAALFALALYPRKKIIYHTQDYLEPGRHKLWELFERRIARNAGHVICNEPNRARFMASNYKLTSSPVVVRTSLPRGWKLPGFDPVVRKEIVQKCGYTGVSNPIVLLHQGGYSRLRCGEQILEALASLPDNFLLIFTGMSENAPAQEELSRTLQRLGVGKRVATLRMLPFEELLKYTASCDIGLLLYPNDGVGNYYQAPGRLTEYLGSGLPVILNDYPGLELLALKYGIGEVADCTNPESISKAILKLSTTLVHGQEETRIKMKNISQGELAYDHDAGKIESIIARTR